MARLIALVVVSCATAFIGVETATGGSVQVVDLGGVTLAQPGATLSKCCVGGSGRGIGGVGHGLAPQTVKTDGGPYALAFPRSFTYMDNGVVFYTSGCARQGKLGED